MDVEKVLLARPRGFCAGVEMAIKALAWMVRVFDPPVYCYHEIVHNQVVVDRFRDLGVVFVDDIEDVPQGAPLMLSAHGSAPEVVAAARAQGGFVGAGGGGAVVGGPAPPSLFRPPGNRAGGGGGGGGGGWWLLLRGAPTF